MSQTAVPKEEPDAPALKPLTSLFYFTDEDGKESGAYAEKDMMTLYRTSRLSSSTIVRCTINGKTHYMKLLYELIVENGDANPFLCINKNGPSKVETIANESASAAKEEAQSFDRKLKNVTDVVDNLNKLVAVLKEEPKRVKELTAQITKINEEKESLSRELADACATSVKLKEEKTRLTLQMQISEDMRMNEKTLLTLNLKNSENKYACELRERDAKISAQAAEIAELKAELANTSTQPVFVKGGLDPFALADYRAMEAQIAQFGRLPLLHYHPDLYGFSDALERNPKAVELQMKVAVMCPLRMKEFDILYKDVIVQKECHLCAKALSSPFEVFAHAVSVNHLRMLRKIGKRMGFPDGPGHTIEDIAHWESMLSKC